jgi:hypothetical protein
MIHELGEELPRHVGLKQPIVDEARGRSSAGGLNCEAASLA